MANPFVEDVAGPAAALSRTGGLTWFDGLSEEKQKKLSVFMIARMMAGTNDPVHLIRLNTVFNPYHFGDKANGVLDLRKQDHMKLLAVAANHGRKVSYRWLKGPGRKQSNTVLECICQYYECSTREAATYSVDAEDLLEMAEDLGWDADQINALKKELSDDTRGTKTTSSKPASSRGRAKK